MSKNYKFVDSLKEVVFIIEEDGRIYRSLIITGIDLANTDYVQFKIDVVNGNELQDSEGVVMSPEAAQAFVATLP